MSKTFKINKETFEEEVELYKGSHAKYKRKAVQKDKERRVKRQELEMKPADFEGIYNDGWVDD